MKKGMKHSKTGTSQVPGAVSDPEEAMNSEMSKKKMSKKGMVRKKSKGY